MKVLILVQASDISPYNVLQRGQEETWNSEEVEGVETIYYLSGEETGLFGNKLYLKCEDGYPMLHWKFKLAVDILWDRGWDIMFRTNASSYVDKKLILEKAKTLPKEKLYCGINGGGFASGCGFFISRDCLQIIRDQFDISPTPFEDAIIGSVLGKNGIYVTPGAERFDVKHGNWNLPDTYHYRCKSDNGDRNKDITAFKKIYEYKQRTHR
jgi:hypothetical protein